MGDWYQVRLRKWRVVLYGRQYNWEKPVQSWNELVLTVWRLSVSVGPRLWLTEVVRLY